VLLERGPGTAAAMWLTGSSFRLLPRRLAQGRAEGASIGTSAMRRPDIGTAAMGYQLVWSELRCAIIQKSRRACTQAHIACWGGEACGACPVAHPLVTRFHLVSASDDDGRAGRV
jgi:hypothetical protein